MPRLLALVLLLSGSPFPAMSANNSPDEGLRYRTCLALAHSTPSKAYEDALIWQNEGGAAPARHCVAMALLGLRDYIHAAEKLEALAYAPDAGDDALRASALGQSGEAWLQANRPEEALRVLSRALDIEINNADFLTNRARALMALDQPVAAHADLDAAIKLHPDNALSLRLRAAVLLFENDLIRAQDDINAALAFEPANVDSLLVRGQIREAMRQQ